MSWFAAADRMISDDDHGNGVRRDGKAAGGLARTAGVRSGRAGRPPADPWPRQPPASRAFRLSTLASYLPAQPLIDAVTRAVQRAPGAPFLNSRDMTGLACWAAGGLLAAILVFRWEPHRPARRRAARNEA